MPDMPVPAPGAGPAAATSGSALTVRRLAGGAGAGHAVLQVDAAAGAGTVAHLHEREDLVVILVTGSLEVHVGGAVRVLREGASARLPRAVPHRMVAGPDGARAVVVCLPGDLADVVVAVQDPAADDDDRAALLAAAGVHAVSGTWTSPA